MLFAFHTPRMAKRVNFSLLSSLLWRRVSSENHTGVFNKLQLVQNTTQKRMMSSQFPNCTGDSMLVSGWLKMHNINYRPQFTQGLHKTGNLFGHCSAALQPRKILKTPNAFQVRFFPTLNQIRKQKPRTKQKKPKIPIPKDKKILIGPQRRGVCVKLVVRTPKKPNSAQRKCAILRLSNGKLITAYIPGEKGNLQEHGVVLFEGGRVQDCPGIKYKIIRRKYDMN